MGSRKLRFAALLGIVFAGRTTAVWAQDGGIEIFSGETLFYQGTRVAVAHLYRQKSGLYDGSRHISDPQDRSLEEHRAVLSLNYGLRADLTVAALVPTIDRHFEQDTPSGTRRIDTWGLGDIALIGKYRFFTRDGNQSSFNTSFIGGIEVPTGETDERDGGVRVAPDLQPGSGSWDPFAALAATFSHRRMRFDGQAFYKLNTRGTQDFDDSDLVSVGTSAAYRFIHEKYPGPSHSARLGVVWQHQTRARSRGDTVANSGSDQILLRPGLTFHPDPALDIVINVDVPVFQHYRGQQLGLDVRTFLALGIRF